MTNYSMNQFINLNSKMNLNVIEIKIQCTMNSASYQNNTNHNSMHTSSCNIKFKDNGKH